MKIIFLILVTIPVFYFDIRYKRLPNWLTLGSWICFGLLITLTNQSDLLPYIISSLTGFVSYLLLYFITSKKMGMGDVKLALFLGGISGITGWYFTNLFASILALCLFLILLMLKKVNRQSKIPFGPFLCSGSLLSLIIKVPLL